MITNQYYVVLGWMVSKLKLTGNELIIYAIIFGTSQDEKWSRLSLDLLSRWTGCHSRTIQRCLSNLVKKGFIFKNSIFQSGTIYNEYACNPKFFDFYCEDGILPPPGESPSNNLYTISNNIKTISPKQYNPIKHNTNSRGLSPNIYSPNNVITKKSAGSRILIKPKSHKTGANFNFNGPEGVRVLLTQLEGGKEILSEFLSFVENCKQLKMVPTKLWYRAQIDILNHIEDNEDKLAIIRKTIENNWRNLRFVAEKMFGNLDVKTKIGGKKNERKTETY